MKDQAFKARSHPVVEQLLTVDKKQLLMLVHGLGSPLHILLPDIFAENIRAFNAVFDELKLTNQIFFAKKANKARCLAKQCALQAVGIDVASVQEFELALAAGLSGESIAVSGPHKSHPLLQLAQAHRALIAVDSCEELDDIIALSCSNKPFRIVLRVKPDFQASSRFGLAANDIDFALEQCCLYKQAVELLGFSAHLNGYSLQERFLIGHQLIDWAVLAKVRGFDCRLINIGGGLPVCYLESDQWRQEINQQGFYGDKSFDHYYPYYHAEAGAAALRKLLLMSNQQLTLTLAERLKQYGLTIAIEPGRVLLDQAGISLFAVKGCKHMLSSADEYLLTVEGMSFSLSEQWFNSEFLPSPRLLSTISNGEKKSCVAAVAGSSCLEADMISWRKICFQRLPQADDLLAYINTAGYQMDSNESEFHSIALPRKVSVTYHNECIQWQLDNR